MTQTRSARPCGHSRRSNRWHQPPTHRSSHPGRLHPRRDQPLWCRHPTRAARRSCSPSTTATCPCAPRTCGQTCDHPRPVGIGADPGRHQPSVSSPNPSRPRVEAPAPQRPIRAHPAGVKTPAGHVPPHPAGPFNLAGNQSDRPDAAGGSAPADPPPTTTRPPANSSAATDPAHTGRSITTSLDRAHPSAPVGEASRAAIDLDSAVRV